MSVFFVPDLALFREQIAKSCECHAGNICLSCEWKYPRLFIAPGKYRDAILGLHELVDQNKVR